ncbi:MAG: beta-lactamase family protein [Clostridia bacterium]|nr:beta-lactamase family protein [Clostridia bacterium]
MDFKKLDEFIDSLPEHKIPACDLSVWQDHKEIYRRSAAQYRDMLPRPDGRYFIYSCSKVITCAAAMTLIERGRMLLETPLSEIIPEFASVRVAQKGGTYTVPASRPILVRDLFCMTSGFGYNLTSAEIRRVRERTGGVCPTLETVKAMAGIPLAFEPGEYFLYGLSHDILAAVIEVLADERFGDYVKRAIFDPLGMENSGFRLTDEIKPFMEKQYRLNDRTGQAEEMKLFNMYILGDGYESGGAGVISTVNDMARFADALACGGVGATGERILSEASIELMRTPMLNFRQRSTFIWPQLGSAYSYGLGVRTLINPRGGALLPLREFGWAGAAGALMICSPELKLSAYYAQHMLNNREEFVHPRLRNVIAACVR